MTEPKPHSARGPREPGRSQDAAARAARAVELAAAIGCVVVVLLARAGSAAPAAQGGEDAPAPAASSAAVEAPRPVAATRPAALPKPSLDAFSCDTPDLGMGDYASVRLKSGVVVYTRDAAIRPDGGYDLLVHFHGGEPVRRVLAPLGRPLVFATLDRGDSSGDYQATIADRQAWDELVASIDREVTAAAKRPAKAERVAVSSFSAGFEATRQVLRAASGDKALRGVLLFDSLYGSYLGGGRSVDPLPLAPFEDAARRALSEPRFVFALTHSEVKTDGYASTGEVADALLDRLVVRAQRIPTATTRGLTRVAEERGFFVRGYAGADKDAHCAHLGLVPELVELWLSRT